jgi:integrase
MISEMPREKRVHRSVRYLHLVGNEWVRTSLDDPNLSHRLLVAAKKAQLPLRDRLIVQIACRYGVRIRDILRCTIGDWRVCECQLELRVPRQVSTEQGVKMLCLSSDTQSLLRAYIRGERTDYDPEHRELSQLTETDPLFLTAKGRAYVYEAFVPRWETLCQAAGISLPLRGLRHWFVIRMLRQIEERTHDPREQRRHKTALIKYMGWQSPKTLWAYELEYYHERLINELDKFEDELFTNGPLLFNEQRSAIERREEVSFWQNYWYTAGDQ